MGFVELLFIAGVVALVAAAVVYLSNHPELLEKIIPQKEQAPVEPERERAGYLAGDQTPLERLREGDIPLDSFLKVSVGDVGRARMQVIGTLILNERRQYGGSKSWDRSGTRWPGLFLTGDPQHWTEPALLLVKGSKTYLFTHRQRLGREETRRFQPFGKAFADEGQVPGRVKLQWQGVEYGIQDVGIYDVTSDGDQHVPETLLCRFIIAHDSNKAILVEDGKGDHDSVWVGRLVEFDSWVKEILTPDGS